MTKIVTYPNDVLRIKTKPIEKVQAKLIREIDELKKELVGAENGAGLAATQLGIEGRFFGIKDPVTKKVKVFINPEITKTYGEKAYPVIVKDDKTSEDFLEGCLSFPDYYGTVRRYLKIDVKWQELINKKLVTKKKALGGFEAIVWQHESDHLDGILFVDWIDLEGGKFYRWRGEKKEVWDVKKVIEGKL
ncbi:MAG: peptide deformylase [Candidatus Shapirobacteria bacterium]